jgi:NAD(P)-dependent dehydrogenase (short-subunit alcohol dehydrogenase family)
MDELVAVVTGASRGLGLEITRQLAGQGLRVILTARSLAKSEEAVRELGDLGSRASALALDVADGDSIKRFAVALNERFGRCDVLVNNAASMADAAEDAVSVDRGLARHILETNVLGAWELIQAVTPAMRARQYGRIVNVSSSAGSFAQLGEGKVPGAPAYRVSKCALNALTRILADELRHDRILVNACCPGRLHPGWGAHSGYTRLAKAADTPVWLATLPADGPTGGFYRDRQPLPW